MPSSNFATTHSPTLSSWWTVTSRTPVSIQRSFFISPSAWWWSLLRWTNQRSFILPEWPRTARFRLRKWSIGRSNCFSGSNSRQTPITSPKFWQNIWRGGTYPPKKQISISPFFYKKLPQVSSSIKSSSSSASASSDSTDNFLSPHSNPSSPTFSRQKRTKMKWRPK